MRALKKSIGPKLLVQSSSAHDLHHTWIQIDEPDVDPFASARSSPRFQHPSAEYSRSGTRLISSANTRGLMLGDERGNLIGDVLGVDEESRPSGAGSAAPRRSRRPDAPAKPGGEHRHPLSPDDRDTRMRGLAGEADERKDDGDDDALQRAEDEHAERRDQWPTETPCGEP